MRTYIEMHKQATLIMQRWRDAGGDPDRLWCGHSGEETEDGRLDNGLLLEAIAKDIRVGFNVEKDPKQDGWYCVKSTDDGIVGDNGPLTTADFPALVRAFDHRKCSWWRQLLGMHHGPFLVGPHVIVCGSCGEFLDD